MNTSQQTSFVIYHQNIRSIRNKKELAIFLNDVCNNPDILCISEHHLSVSELSIFSVTKYKIATGFSRTVCKNGGVCILVKDNISYQKLDLNNFSMDTVLEVCGVKIIINNRKLCVSCLYRAPDGDINQFIEQFDFTLSYLVNLKLEPIICGDTNTEYLSKNHKKLQLQFLLDTYNLAQVIVFPTRKGPTSASLMDNFFLDRNIYNKFQAYSVINGLSDHDRQILITENLQVMRQSDYVRAFRDINDENIAYFQWALQNEN
jgi:hypothetical protein